MRCSFRKSTRHDVGRPEGEIWKLRVSTVGVWCFIIESISPCSIRCVVWRLHGRNQEGREAERPREAEIVRAANTRTVPDRPYQLGLCALVYVSLPGPLGLPAKLAPVDPAVFTRIHRSPIVNTTRVQEIRPDPHGDSHVVLTDGRMLRMSRTFRERLLGR